MIKKVCKSSEGVYKVQTFRTLQVVAGYYSALSFLSEASVGLGALLLAI